MKMLVSVSDCVAIVAQRHDYRDFATVTRRLKNRIQVVGFTPGIGKLFQDILERRRIHGKKVTELFCLIPTNS